MRAILLVAALHGFVSGLPWLYGNVGVCSPGATAMILALKKDSCGGQWQMVKANAPDSKVVLKFINPKGGQPMLMWSGVKGKLAEVDIHKAKGPINSQGEAEICSQGASMTISEDSYLIKELRQDQKLQPGYYAVRVLFHLDRGVVEASNWVVIRIR